MKYIENYGGVWRVTEARHAALTADIRAGREVNLDDYGKYLGNVRRLRDLEDELSPEATRFEGAVP